MCAGCDASQKCLPTVVRQRHACRIPKGETAGPRDLVYSYFQFPLAVFHAGQVMFTFRYPTRVARVLLIQCRPRHRMNVFMRGLNNFE